MGWDGLGCGGLGWDGLGCGGLGCGRLGWDGDSGLRQRGRAPASGPGPAPSRPLSFRRFPCCGFQRRCLRHCRFQRHRCRRRHADRRGAAPDPGDHQDLVLLSERGEAAPGARLAQVPQLGGDELGQPLALQHRPGGEPGQHARREDVEPERGVTEREAEHREDNHVGNDNSREYADQAHRERHRQPEVIQLVEPFLDPPDIGIGGQIHRLRPFCLRRDQWTPSAPAIPVASVRTMSGV